MAAFYNNAQPFAGNVWDFIANLEQGGPRGPHPRGGPHGGPHGFHRGRGQGPRPCGPGRGPGRGNQEFPPFVQDFMSQLFGNPAGNDADNASSSNNTSEPAGSASKPFSPAVDIFSSQMAYTLHVSLPGAKRSDIGLNYNADNAELSVSGVVHRPGDEEFQRTLVEGLGERGNDLGVFERKIKLGELATAKTVGDQTTDEEKKGQSEPGEIEIDVDGITAKLEDGVLVVTVPKIEKFVEIHKVDIE